MSSLRRAIASRVVTLLAAVGLSAAATSFVFVTREMDSFLDAQLQEIAINLGPANRSGGAPLLETEDEDHLAVRIWDHNGQLLHRSGPAADIGWQPVPGLSDVTENGRAWRVYRWSDARQNVQIAQTWSARREIATNAAAGAALPLLLAIPLAWYLIRRAVDRTLRGLQRLSVDIGQRSIDAREPLRPVGVPDEVVSLIDAIDQLVERHRQALEAQRRFVADAAHELRTPLAALQIQTANLLADHPGLVRQEIFDEFDSGVRRAARLTNQLLEMARVEGASLRIRETVDLVALIRSVLAEFVPLAEACNIELGISADKAISVETNPHALSQLIRVLLDNAVRYASRGGAIDIRIGRAGINPVIEIVDDGPGIPADAMPFIYDRFFRAAPQDIEGTGLGLAIAKATADHNGLGLSHRNRTDSSGTIATVTFPASVDAASV